MKWVILVVCLFSLSTAVARDTRHKFSIKEALNTPAAKSKLDPNIKFLFGSKSRPKNIQRDFGEYQSNKKTNAFNKSDKEACLWVFLSAMLSFQDRVRQLGGNAIVGLQSYYKKGLLDSSTEFECGAGAIMAGVTFKGHIVKLK